MVSLRANHLIAQETDAPQGHGGEMCKRPLQSTTLLYYGAHNMVRYRADDAGDPITTRRISYTTHRMVFLTNELVRYGAVPSRRLEDRIHELCAKAVATETEEANLVLQKLRAALHEHNERLRKLAAKKLIFKKAS